MPLTAERAEDVHVRPVAELLDRAVAEFLRIDPPRPDVVARYGGEEFVVIMPDTTLESAQRIAAFRASVDGEPRVAAPRPPPSSPGRTPPAGC